MRAVSCRWGIPFSLSSWTLPLLVWNRLLGPVHMIPGQLIASGQLTDPRVNFASVHGLTAVTVHRNFSLAGATSRGGLHIVQHHVTGLAKVTFLYVNGTQSCPGSRVVLHIFIIAWNKLPNK